ncbi:MAG: hypothetical protein R3E97_05515 [Candidatus Eisenbacteria bacterium]
MPRTSDATFPVPDRALSTMDLTRPGDEGPADEAQPTEGDRLVFQVSASKSMTTVEVSDPFGRLDTDAVHEIPNTARSYGQEFGGPRNFDYDQFMAVSIETPINGTYEIEVATDVPNVLQLFVTGWSWGAGCDLGLDDVPVAPGRHIWSVDFRRDATGRCQLSAQ